MSPVKLKERPTSETPAAEKPDEPKSEAPAQGAVPQPSALVKALGDLVEIATRIPVEMRGLGMAGILLFLLGIVMFIALLFMAAAPTAFTWPLEGLAVLFILLGLAVLYHAVRNARRWTMPTSVEMFWPHGVENPNLPQSAELHRLKLPSCGSDSGAHWMAVWCDVQARGQAPQRYCYPFPVTMEGNGTVHGHENICLGSAKRDVKHKFTVELYRVEGVARRALEDYYDNTDGGKDAPGISEPEWQANIEPQGIVPLLVMGLQRTQ